MNKLIIAIQKKGRLSEKSMDLLRSAGISISNGSSKLKAVASNYPIEVLFLRDDDIPQYVENGVADLGILGQNEVLEKQKDVQHVLKLGFGKCRMSMAIPKNVTYTGEDHFENKTVATSYPNILKNYFQENKINGKIEEISGSVEIAPSIGLADAVFDIVSTGSTLTLNGLKEVRTILKSEAVLISNANLSIGKKEALDKLVFRFKSVISAKENKYILLNAPNDRLEEIISTLPGMRSPSVLPLADSNWSSVHSVIHEGQFWEIIDELRSKGAEGILVLPIEKMIL
ncbi:MAG: ATP phosphoribosyltransferase [Flavobacteriales bacterium]|nr:ATP phosphoribosyltransferase [Flavobacteriales bacterium]